MSGFDEARKGLAESRRQRAAAEAALRDAAHAVRLAERAAQSQPRADAGGDGARRKKELAKAEAAARETLKSADAALLKAGEAFAKVSDPRKGIAELADDDPILLFPVRLETRFKPVVLANGSQQTELLVRIYPDSCLIDTFESELSVAELASAKAFLCAQWRANGDETLLRAAWQSLARHHGPGRARWIARSYQPLNPKDQPTFADGAITLVIASEDVLPASEADVVADYWQQVYLAGADGKKLAAADDFITGKLGADRAADVKARLAPFDFASLPAASSLTGPPVVRVVFLTLPPPPPLRASSWSAAARAEPLPDRFVLVLRRDGAQRVELGGPVRNPLYAGFDPTGVNGGTPVSENGALSFPDETRWMADFDEAVKAGMGLRLPLSAAEAAEGFKRIYALGVSLGDDAEAGRKRLEQMIENRLHSGAGFEIVPQGTPTNNTEERDSGFSRGEDPDRVYDALQGDGLYAESDHPLKKRDGQLLADGLGVDNGIIKRVLNADGQDQALASAVNTALWPATLGYFMADMLAPAFDRKTIAETRRHFIDHVSGRGRLPAIRIGRQPYGILPITAFERVAWTSATREHPRRDDFLARAQPLLEAMDKRWSGFSANVKHTGSAGDAQQNLIDILALHPGSVEFHYRYAQSFTQAGYYLQKAGVNWTVLDEPRHLTQTILGFLKEFGFTGSVLPRIASLLFQRGQGVLDGGVVSSLPLRPGFEDEHQRYVTWLWKAAEDSVERLRLQKDMPDDNPPQALFYIMLRHALLLAYSTAAAEAHFRLPGFSETRFRALTREEPLPHVRVQRPARLASESKWEVLFKVDPNISEGRQVALADYLTANLGKIDETASLADQLDALKLIAGSSLEAADLAFREHIDLCTYRFDAWKLAVPRLQLERMKRKGVYLGAYGWLHDVKPQARTLTNEKRPAEETALLDPDGKLPQLVRDSRNGGLIQAPSLNHAVTGAILRNAYMSADSTAGQEAIGVNLSSERVRNALYLADGMRMGQSLNALLGYRFERGLKDSSDAANAFLAQLRLMFPLSADSLKDTAATGNEDGSVAARNVVDGLKLVEQMRKSSTRTYPFGLVPQPDWPTPTGSAAAAINAEAQKLEDLNDSLGDLVLAEAVHQSVLGNFDRVASSLDAFAKGEAPPDPDVVRTPTTGISLTHRVGLHLDVDAAGGTTPRAVAEPALNAWLGAVLPAMGKIGCTVEWKDPVTAAQQELVVTLADIGLEPIDLIYRWQDSDHTHFAETDDLITEYAIGQRPTTLRTDTDVTLRYMDGPANGISMFEAAALVRPLAALVRQARALRPGDLQMESEATLAVEQSQSSDTSGVEAGLVLLKTLVTELETFVASAAAAQADATTTHEAAVQAVDTLLSTACGLLMRANRFGVQLTQTNRFRDAARRIFRGLAKLVDDLATQWEGRLARCDALLATLPGDDEAHSIQILRGAEVELPMPALAAATGADDLATEITAKRDAFAGQIADYRALLDTRNRAITTFIEAVEALLADPDYTTQDTSTTAMRAEIGGLVAELHAGMDAIRQDAVKRVTATRTKLNATQALPDGPARCAAADEAAQALLGEGFKLVPVFTLGAPQRSAFADALQAAQSGETLKYLRQTMKMALPVDEWLHGIARVREAMRNLEMTSLLADGFATAPIALTAMQFPYRAGDSWLGLDFPKDYDIDRARLLYTAHMVAAPAGDGRFRGLMIDEWTEVVPGARREEGMAEEAVHTQTTGVSFHFDRPNAEAPQCWLLVTPASWDGKWNWDDLVGALDSAWDLMRKRAVVPAHVDDEVLSQLLPATVAAAAVRDVTISAVLANNINVAKFMKE